MINCLGPHLSFQRDLPVCLKSLLDAGKISLDPLGLGFKTDQYGAIYQENNQLSHEFYSLGSPTKGVNWECTSVPDIRHQVYVLAKHLLKR